MDYALYFADSETTGLDERDNDIIELSLIRLSDNVQKIWFIKPINMENIEQGALRINGHKIEDLRGETKLGREKYLDPNKVIIEIENWLAEDGLPTENRVLVGQNISFDKNMMRYMWNKCSSKDSFPFGRRMIDTMSIELFMDAAKGAYAEGYSLNNLTKKYGVKNNKAHSAESDVLATKEVYEKQIAFFKKMLNA